MGEIQPQVHVFNQIQHSVLKKSTRAYLKKKKSSVTTTLCLFLCYGFIHVYIYILCDDPPSVK